MKNLLIFFAVVSFLILIIVVFLLIGHQGQIEAYTNKEYYYENEPIHLKIVNGTSKDICFSPHSFSYIDKLERGEWWYREEPYLIENNKNIIEDCISQKDLKAFETDFSIYDLSGEGEYRLAIPICMDCSFGESFKKDSWIFTNNFEIKYSSKN